MAALLDLNHPPSAVPRARVYERNFTPPIEDVLVLDAYRQRFWIDSA